MPTGRPRSEVHIPAAIFARNRFLRGRNHPKTAENLIFCELRKSISETSSLVTLPSSGESVSRAILPPTANARLFARVCGPAGASAVSRDGYRAVHGATRREYLCRAKFQYRGVDEAVA